LALYRGYFGAGIGILILAALSVLGLTDIHQMNGLKALLGAIIGGYGGALIARRLGSVAVRRIVIIVGRSMAESMFIKFFRTLV
jgi:hypothetical protein